MDVVKLWPDGTSSDRNGGRVNENMILTIDLKAEYSRDEGIDELIFGFEEQHNSQTSAMNSWETN